MIVQTDPMFSLKVDASCHKQVTNNLISIFFDLCCKAMQQIVHKI